jgi:hypothetical protein
VLIDDLLRAQHGFRDAIRGGSACLYTNSNAVVYDDFGQISRSAAVFFFRRYSHSLFQLPLSRHPSEISEIH